ncbi:MAG: superinfection immunity protein [Pseudonocardiaceae bacterium]|nr:superinfection immunity protein [Pseudonocardiaceae bacterium]
MTESTTPAQHPDPGFRTTTEQDTPAKILAVAIGVLSAGYFVPGTVATWRNTDNQPLVWWLSALTSWTVIGWFVALILAAQRTEKHRLSIEKSWPARHPVLLAGSIVMAVGFVVSVASSAASGPTQPAGDTSAVGSSAGSDDTGGTAQDQVINLEFGDSYSWPGGEEITVSAPESFTADNMFNEPDGRYVSMDVTIVNNGDGSYQGMEADFTVQHNGRPAQENWMDSDTLPDVQIPPGGQTTITLVYDIGTEPGEITVSAQPNMFASTAVYYVGQI